MSDLVYLLIVCMIAFTVPAFAGDQCPEGQVFDPELEICVTLPVEAPKVGY